MRIRPTAKTAFRTLLALIIFLLAAAHVSSQTVAQYRASGHDYLSEADYYRAVEAFTAALEINPSDLGALAGIAESYYWLGEYDQAERFAERARGLSGGDASILTMSGRIAIGLGELNLAQAHFEEARRTEPNNVDADIGLAELALAEGRSLDATQALERSLRIRPDNRKALLSLALIYEQSGDYESAEEYLELALRVHGSEPETHILAAEYALRRGRLEEAGSHARTAQALDVNNARAARIRATIALLDRRYLESVVTAEELIQEDRSNVFAWYLRGQALASTGDNQGAMDSFRTALRYEPDNEMIRIVAESLALRAYPLEDPIRTELAEYVEARARRYTSEFRYSRAVLEYQRALRLTPFDSDLRRAYAEVQRSLGYNATYLQELRVIEDSGEASPDTSRRISVFENLLSESVATRWDVDQFTLDKRNTELGLYLIAGPGDLLHTGAESALVEAISRNMRSSEHLEVVETRVLTDVPTAFAEARSQDVDYFVIIRVREEERAVELEVSVRVGRTGNEAASYQVIRSGPERVSDAVSTLVRRVEGMFPLEATILRRDRNRVLLDVGRRDGIEGSEELTIVTPGSLIGLPDRVGSAFGNEAILGTVTVTAVDDLVSEGTIAIQGIVDEVVPGDLAILPGEDLVEGSGGAFYPLIYQRVRALR